MSKNNKALVVAEKTVESLRELSAKAYNNYTESSDRYYLGKTQAYTVAADMLEMNVSAEPMGEAMELNEALDTIDDMVNVIGKQIIRIAHDNDNFVCSCCLTTAHKLFKLMKKYAREEDTEFVRSRWKEITGLDIWG